MADIKLGSLFDGIGVFPLAASRCGIVPVWASEIEKAPVSVTMRHFPEMEHLGDITKIDGGQVEPVHVATFGSPCQNLSLAGFRKGLAGAKSGLFFEAVRIMEEMRCATDGLYPTFTVWENVMGAFSSNNRMDFRAVLQSFTDTEVPMPPSGRWAGAGMVRGGEGLTSAGGSWTPSVGEGPRFPREESVSSSWSILEEGVPETFYLSPAVCSRLLRLAETAGFPPPERIEYLLKKQGGAYPSSIPFRQGGCAEPQGTRTGRTSSGALDGQMTLSQLYSPGT